MEKTKKDNSCKRSFGREIIKEKEKKKEENKNIVFRLWNHSGGWARDIKLGSVYHRS